MKHQMTNSNSWGTRMLTDFYLEKVCSMIPCMAGMVTLKVEQQLLQLKVSIINLRPLGITFNLLLHVTVILKNLTSSTREILDGVRMWSLNKTWIIENNISTSFIPTMLFCQYLDVTEIFDFEIFNPLQIFFDFRKVKDVRVSLLIQERNKRMRRGMKYLQNSYAGQLLIIDDLDKPQKIRASIRMSQTINLQEDLSYPCMDYPSEEFVSYGECDNIHVSRFLHDHFGVSPFWTVDDLNDVTKLKHVPQAHNSDYADFFDGTHPSECLIPCHTTKVK